MPGSHAWGNQGLRRPGRRDGEPPEAIVFFGASQGFFLYNGCVQVIGRFLAVYMGV